MMVRFTIPNIINLVRGQYKYANRPTINLPEAIFFAA